MHLEFLNDEWDIDYVFELVNKNTVQVDFFSVSEKAFRNQFRMIIFLCGNTKGIFS